MAELKLDIWVDDCNTVHVEEEGKKPADRHRASKSDEIRWKRKTAGHKPFDKWIVRLEQEDGTPLPGTDSPFEGQQTEFVGRQGQPQCAKVITEREQNIKYSVYCYERENDQDPFAERDPILVINDPGKGLRDEVEEISTRLDRIEELLSAMSTQLADLAGAIKASD